MKPLCFIFGAIVGIFSSNALWITNMVDKGWCVTGAIIFAAAGTFALHYDWFGEK